MVEPAFRTLLVNASAVTALVSDRIYHQHKPQDAPSPCIVLTRVSTRYIRAIDGKVLSTSGRMQVDSFGPSIPVAKQLAEVVRGALDKFVGTVAGTTFHWITADDERDLPNAPPEGRATPLFAVSTDFRFLHDH
jgi:hypothetical protein